MECAAIARRPRQAQARQAGEQDRRRDRKRKRVHSGDPEMAPIPGLLAVEALTYGLSRLKVAPNDRGNGTP
jgi:hypothetical protein